MWIVGVVGLGPEGGDSDKFVVSIGAGREYSGSGSGGFFSSSANTRVGLGCEDSHGKIGFGVSAVVGGAAGIEYHISFGGSGYDFGGWKSFLSADIV